MLSPINSATSPASSAAEPPVEGGLLNVANESLGPEGRDRIREQLENLMETLRG